MGHQRSRHADLRGRMPVVLGALLSLMTCASRPSAPHIIFVLTDDLGWNSVYNNERTFTPFLDSLAATEAVKLTDHHTYRFCAPSRASFLTGRLPYHLAATRTNFIPWSTPDGTELDYVMIPRHLAKANYYTVHIGKWHQGFFMEEYTPVARGFNESFGFLEGGENHETSATDNEGDQCRPNGVDLSYGWSNGTTIRPAIGRNGTYTGYQFSGYAVEAIRRHSLQHAEQPLFMYLALQNTHGPVQAPQRFVDLYDGTQVTEELEQIFNAMVSVVDETVRNVTAALKSYGMWQNTLMVWTTDNGAPVQKAGSNHPLRGGKGSDWEGGTRTPAFVTGGILPAKMRGTSLSGIAHICDWYATFSQLAGLGGEADPSGPAPPESLDLSAWLFGVTSKSPRSGFVYDHRMYGDDQIAHPTGALRDGDLKLVVGGPWGLKMASWYGIFSPNSSGKPDLGITACSAPCLFNVSTGADIGEHFDLSAHRQADLARLLQAFDDLRDTYHPPRANPALEEKAYCKAMRDNHGFVRPWRASERSGVFYA